MADKAKGQSDPGSVALATLDKEQVKQLFLQLIGFARLGGWFSFRLKVAADLAEKVVTAHWDEIWQIISGEPDVIATINQLAGHVQGEAAFSPATVAAETLELYRARGSAVPQWLGQCADMARDSGFGVKQDRKSENYYKTKQGIAGVLMMAQAIAFMTRSKTDDEYVRLCFAMFASQFDEFWRIEHPEEFGDIPA